MHDTSGGPLHGGDHAAFASPQSLTHADGMTAAMKAGARWCSPWWCMTGNTRGSLQLLLGTWTRADAHNRGAHDMSVRAHVRCGTGTVAQPGAMTGSHGDAHN